MLNSFVLFKLKIQKYHNEVASLLVVVSVVEGHRCTAPIVQNVNKSNSLLCNTVNLLLEYEHLNENTSVVLVTDCSVQKCDVEVLFFSGCCIVYILF